MSINLDVVIDTPEHTVDMKAGLDTLQGVSDAVRQISETILTGHTPQRLTHKSKVRTALKQSFKGSYGHVFGLEIFDDILKAKFRSIGRVVFSELISHFLVEALYLESRPLSNRAQKIVDGLGVVVDHLLAQMRVSALENIHEISTKFDHEVKIRFRKSRDEQTVLARFNRETAEVLQAEETDEKVDLMVAITRLNINTGNGRFHLEGEADTVAFGFGIEYRAVKFDAKKVFSENLNHNNGLESKNWRRLKVSATPIKLKDGKVIKYIVKGLYRD